MDDDDTITDAELKVRLINEAIRNQLFKWYFIFNKEPKKSFREKLAEIQEICLKIQEALDYIASMGERVVKYETHYYHYLLANHL